VNEVLKRAQSLSYLLELKLPKSGGKLTSS
jgi:hypothetical protein